MGLLRVPVGRTSVVLMLVCSQRGSGAALCSL